MASGAADDEAPPGVSSPHDYSVVFRPHLSGYPASTNLRFPGVELFVDALTYVRGTSLLFRDRWFENGVAPHMFQFLQEFAYDAAGIASRDETLVTLERLLLAPSTRNQVTFAIAGSPDTIVHRNDLIPMFQALALDPLLPGSTVDPTTGRRTLHVLSRFSGHMFQFLQEFAYDAAGIASRDETLVTLERLLLAPSTRNQVTFAIAGSPDTIVHRNDLIPMFQALALDPLPPGSTVDPTTGRRTTCSAAFRANSFVRWVPYLILSIRSTLPLPPILPMMPMPMMPMPMMKITQQQLLLPMLKIAVCLDRVLLISLLNNLISL